MPKKKSILPAVRKAGPIGPLTLEDLRKPHATLSAHATVKYIPPTVEQAAFIREGLRKGLTMAQIKKQWEEGHQLT
jgi:hypothetical protein